MSRRDPPQLHDSLTPVEVDGETVWYSADGRWVVVSRRTMARWTEGRSDSSAGRRERPAPVDMGPELGGVLMRLSPGAAEAGDDTTEEVVPTVVVVDPKKVELVRAEPSAPSLVSRPSVPKAPVVAPPASPWRAVTLALVALSGLLLFLAAGIKIGTELTRRNAAVAVAVTPPEPQEAHTTIEARPAPSPVPTAVEPVPAEPRPVEPPTVEPRPVEPPTVEPPTVEPTPPSVAPATPKPAAPRPTATPAPRDPDAGRKPAWQLHVDAGWKSVEGSPAAAAEHFREALDDRPGHPDASYGYGYALLKLGRPSDARPYLCAARAGDASIRREITGLMAEHGLSCE